MSRRPLVVVTRARADAAAMVGAIEAHGAQALVVPCLQQVALAPRPGEASWLPEVVGRLCAIAFASRMGVLQAAERLAAQAIVLPDRVSLFAVGPPTAALAQAHFGRPVQVASPSDADHLLALLLQRLPPASEVLLPAAQEGRRVLEQGLVQHGHRAHRWLVYETQLPRERLRPLPWSRAPAYVLFASPSAVHGWHRQLSWPPDARALSIGPTTSEALAQVGIPVYRQSPQHDADGLLECLYDCLQENV